MADVSWPMDLLKPAGGRAKPAFATISGGRSLSGIEQVIANDAGFWTLTMHELTVTSEDALRVWNEIELILGGRSGTVLVPVLTNSIPYPVDGNGDPITAYAESAHSDGAYFSDGSGYAQDVISATTENSIAARAVTGQFRFSAGGELKAGMYWGVGERAYRIKSIDSSFTDGSGTVYVVSFWPPAREAIAGGTALELLDPRFRARLATDSEMAFDADVLYRGRPSLDFIEDV